MIAEPTVFIVDDDHEARASVCALVGSVQGHCEQFASAEDFLEVYDPKRPGCLITDLRMRGMSGLELQKEIVRRGWTLSVVLVSGYINVRSTVQAMKFGAEHVLKKPYSDQELWDAIQAAIRRDAEARAHQAARNELNARFSKLSRDERRVLDLVATGLPNKTVARRLDVGVRTVEDRRRRVMAKLGVSSFAALMRLYARMNAAKESTGSST